MSKKFITKDIFGRDIFIGDLVYIPHYQFKYRDSVSIYLVIHKSELTIKLIDIATYHFDNQTLNSCFNWQVNSTQNLCIIPDEIKYKINIKELFKSINYSEYSKPTIKQLKEVEKIL